MEDEIKIVQELLAMGVNEKDIIAEMSIIADLQSKMPHFIKMLTKAGISEKEAIEKVKLANSADPTGDKAGYTQWIIKMMLNKSIIMPEDTEKVKYALESFHTFKKNPKLDINKDIMSYKTFGDLYSTITDLDEEDLSKGEKEKVRLKKGAKVIYDDGTYKLYEFSTGEAASAYCWHWWGDNIKKCPWCFSCAKTAQEGYIDQYNSNIIVIEKNGKPYAAFQLGSKQLEDYRAQFPPIGDPMWEELYPILKEATGVVVLEMEDEDDIEFDIAEEEEGAKEGEEEVK